MKQVTLEWLKSARDDIHVIERIISDIHLSNMVAFHAQQCIEKCFKAIIEQQDLPFIKTHDLLKLYDLVKGFILIDDLDTLTTIADLYTDSRYPTLMGLLPDGKPSAHQAANFYGFANLIYNQVEAKLK
jgi:HEPN domain-containing protein